MAQNILTAVVYLIMITIMVSVVNLCIGFFQVIEDIAAIRKRVWKLHSRSFRKIHKSPSRPVEGEGTAPLHTRFRTFPIYRLPAYLS